MVLKKIKEEKILINNLEINYKTIGEEDSSSSSSFDDARVGDGKFPEKGNISHFLILHGWGSNSDKWVKVLEILSQNNIKIICPDLPGFGKSQKLNQVWGIEEYCDFVNSFVNSLNLEKIYLLGHSFGGSVAIKYSIKYPQKIEKLFLVSVSCIRRKSFKKVFFLKISKIFKIFFFLPFYNFFRKAFYKLIIRKSDYLYFNEGKIRESYLKIIKQDLSKELYLISNETIIIWGRKDNITPVKDAYMINKKIKDSILIIIPEGDHDLEQKLPDILSKKILNDY